MTSHALDGLATANAAAYAIYAIMSKSQLSQLKKNHGKLHPDTVWNEGALGFEERRPNKNNKMSSVKLRSKTVVTWCALR